MLRNSALVWWGWFALWALLEIPAVEGWVPWMPLSDYVWSLEDRWPWMPYAIVTGFAALLAHLVVKKFH